MIDYILHQYFNYFLIIHFISLELLFKFLIVFISYGKRCLQSVKAKVLRLHLLN